MLTAPLAVFPSCIPMLVQNLFLDHKYVHTTSYLFSSNNSPDFTTCLSPLIEVTFLLVVLIKPGFILFSSMRYGYNFPSNDIKMNCVGLTHFQIAKGPTKLHLIFLLPVCNIAVLPGK